MTTKKTDNTHSSSLDSSLLSYINSEQRWEAFKAQFVNPLTIKQRGPLTGNVLYDGYPANCDPLDYLSADSTYLGKSSHLLLVSLVYHITQVTKHRGTSDYLDVASHFDSTHYCQHFSSLTKHTVQSAVANDENNRDTQLSLMRIWDFRIEDYIQAYQLNSDCLINCPLEDPLLYNWQMSGISHAISITEHGYSEWSKRFTPLRYYQWMIPESKLSKLDFYLDPNTSYMYSWLQDYLAKCRIYRTKIEELAKAVKGRDAYRKKLDALSQRFVERNAHIASGIRANIDKVGRPQDRRRELLTRQFLQQLSTLYGKYLRQINSTDKKK